MEFICKFIELCQWYKYLKSKYIIYFLDLFIILKFIFGYWSFRNWKFIDKKINVKKLEKYQHHPYNSKPKIERYQTRSIHFKRRRNHRTLPLFSNNTFNPTSSARINSSTHHRWWYSWTVQRFTEHFQSAGVAPREKLSFPRRLCWSWQE